MDTPHGEIMQAVAGVLHEEHVMDIDIETAEADFDNINVPWLEGNRLLVQAAHVPFGQHS